MATKKATTATEVIALTRTFHDLYHDIEARVKQARAVCNLVSTAEGVEDDAAHSAWAANSLLAEADAMLPALWAAWQRESAHG